MQDDIDIVFDNFFGKSADDLETKQKVLKMNVPDFINYLRLYEKEIQKLQLDDHSRKRAIRHLLEVGISDFVSCDLKVNWHRIINAKAAYILYMMFSNGLDLSCCAPPNAWDILDPDIFPF